MLYFRMFLMMIIALFSFKLLLSELGDTGYGTYNVVGGVIVLFSFISSAMIQSIQRFLSYSIGKGDPEMLRKVFSTSINIQIIISLILLAIAESVGLWFLNSHMVFPEGMMYSVNWVYQCSLIVFVIQFMIIPYQSVTISHEKMSVYAWISIIESILKLSAVFMLWFFNEYKLEIYSSALVMAYLLVWGLYYVYLHSRFPNCRYSASIERGIFRRLFSFSGWNLLGGLGNAGATQGVNIIFNIFRGVIVNAAMGVASQVGNVISSLLTIQTAFNPQIIKTYATGDRDGFISLVFRSSRFSFLLVFMAGLPLITGCRTVLGLWLGDVPEFAIPFSQLMICFFMIDAASGSLWTAVQASGDIKAYMIIISLMIFSNLPAAYLLLYLGLSPVWVMFYKVAANLLIHFARLIFLRKLVAFPSGLYCRKVMLPILIYILMCIPLPVYMTMHMGESISEIIMVMVVTLLECGVSGYFVMLSKSERKFIMTRVVDKFKMLR